MRRRAVVAFVAVFAAGVIGLLATGLTRGSELVYSLGAAPAGVAVQIPAGSVACQCPSSSGCTETVCPASDTLSISRGGASPQTLIGWSR